MRLREHRCGDLRPYYNGDGGANDFESNFLGDKASWNAMISDLGITAEIAVVVTESIPLQKRLLAGLTPTEAILLFQMDIEPADISSWQRCYRGLDLQSDLPPLFQQMVDLLTCLILLMQASPFFGQNFKL